MRPLKAQAMDFFNAFHKQSRYAPQPACGQPSALQQHTRNPRATQQKAVRERPADTENGERLGAKIHSFSGPAVVQ